MKLFRLAFHAFRLRLVVIILISLFSGASNAALIALISKELTHREIVNLHFILAFAGLVCAVIISDFLAKWLLTKLTGWTSYYLRMSIARQIVAMPFATLEQIGVPRLFAILTEDITNISQALNSLPGLSISVATLAGCLLYLGWLSPLLVALMGILALPTILGYVLLQRKARALIKAAFHTRDQVANLYRSLTEGAKELKINSSRRQAFFRQLLQPSANMHQQLTIDSRTWHQIAQSWSQSIYFIFIFGVFVWSSWHQRSIADVAAYALIILFARTSVNSLLNALPAWTDANVAINQIEALSFVLTFHRERSEYSAPLAAPLRQVQLDLTGVTYQYMQESDERVFSLGPVDLTFHSGQLIFLTGGNGSGKTTLIKLIAGLYSPQAGAIFFNGEAIYDGNREAYQQNFSAIFADSYLFEQLLGLSTEALDVRARYYLAHLQLDHKVVVQDGCLSTIALSHGQRKRLALLSAYLEDRPIYLFDEWAASQDPEFREIFYRQLLPELKMRGKLVIVISHDDHYYDVADRVIKLDFGQVVPEPVPAY